MKVAVAQKNDAGIATAIEGLISSGSMPQDQLGGLYVNLGKTRYNLKQYPQAIAAFEKAQQLDPNNAEIVPLLAQARSVGGNPNDAVATLRQAIAQQSANGAKAPEDMYKRAISLAYKSKLPVTPELSRQWVSAYPTRGELERRDPHLSQSQQRRRCGDARPVAARAGGQGAERRVRL